jgi:hypothetical protein
MNAPVHVVEASAVLAADPLATPQAHPVAAIPANDALPSARVITPADLLAIAMQSSTPDIERLERLMAMNLQYREQQEQDRQRDAMLAFREDFARLRGENIIIPKSLYVDRGKAGSFNQAEYDRVCGMLSPALSRHGFGFRHDPKFTSRKWTGDDGVERDIPWVIVVCFLEHRRGHAETVTLEGPPGDLSANTPVQNMQTTASYLKRQSLLAITGTATGGEDNEAAMRNAEGGGQAGAPSTTQSREKQVEADQLADAGNAAAAEGSASLTAWWGGLSQPQRERVMGQFGAMKAAARKADGAKAA